MINESSLLKEGFTKGANDEFYIHLKNGTQIFIKEKERFYWHIIIRYDSEENSKEPNRSAVGLPKKFEDISEIQALLKTFEDK